MNTAAPPVGRPLKVSSRTVARGRPVRLAVARALLELFPPFSLSRCRQLALRACGLRAGRSTWFWGLPRVSGPGPLAERLKIGSECGFNAGCEFDLAAPVLIGDRVAVGHDVRFLTSVRAEDDGTAAPITICDGVWIGARCTLMGGVTVGAGSVVGAGMTVSADVPPNTLLAGPKPVSLARWR